jgi:tellurite resistance protein TerC
LSFDDSKHDGAALPTNSEHSGQQDNYVLTLLSSIMPISTRYDPKGRFFVREDEDATVMAVVKDSPDGMFGKLLAPVKGLLTRIVHAVGLNGYKATPLVAVLLIVESTDMIFAADSIPAVLSITQDSFIAYTSNIFAVLGLRALYFALAAAMAEFEYLGPGLGVILLFIGSKLLLTLVEIHIGVELTLIVVLGVLAVAIGLSWLKPSSKESRGRITSSGSVSDAMFDETE